MSKIWKNYEIHAWSGTKELNTFIMFIPLESIFCERHGTVNVFE
jgi:DNA anti-recombination protein RmuC